MIGHIPETGRDRFILSTPIVGCTPRFGVVSSLHPVEQGVDEMPEFMDVHHGMVGITAEGLKEAHDADLAIQGEENVEFKQAWADPESGNVYCLSEASSAEAVQRIHVRAGHPYDEIHPVPLKV
jgi:hypothetical protein